MLSLRSKIESKRRESKILLETAYALLASRNHESKDKEETLESLEKFHTSEPLVSRSPMKELPHVDYADKLEKAELELQEVQKKVSQILQEIADREQEN